MSYLNEKPVQFWFIFAVAVVGFFILFQPILAPFVVGFAVAYLLNPIVARLAHKGIPRWVSSLVILSLFFLIIVVTLLALIPMLIIEMIDFIKLMPDLFVHGQQWFATKFPMVDISASIESAKDIDPSVLSDKLGSIFKVGQNIVGDIFKSGMAIIGFISFIALMPIVAFYLLVDWARVGNAINSLLPTKNAGRIQTIVGDIDTSLAGFIRGQLTVCFLLGLFYAIALSIAGIQYGFFIGVAAGLLSIIPYVGSLFGLVASVGMAFYQFGGWEMPLVAFIIFIVGQLVEGNYLTPKLVGDSVGLHPLWVIFALMAGGTLMGLMGMIVAVPVAAVIAVLVRHAIDIYRQSPYFKGKG